MDRKTKDRKKWEDEQMYQAHRAERLERAITAAVIIAVAIAMGVSLWAVIETFMFPLIEALGGGQ